MKGGIMIRITKDLKLKPKRIIKRAEDFFGENGFGLQIAEKGPCCISFKGGNGLVNVLVVKDQNINTVDIETQEWEHPDNDFF